MTDEINPQHPVTSALHDHWHKIVAMLIHKYERGQNVGEVTITTEDMDSYNETYPDSAVLARIKNEGIHLMIITREQAKKLAETEKGQ